MMRIAACLLLLFFQPVQAGDFILVASTTSTENSGFFNHLLPPFEDRYGIEVRVVSIGSGAALQYGRRCDVDVVMVHAPEQEEAFVDAGFGVERHALMHNDFVLAGPATDPAGVGQSAGISEAFARIAERQARFVSRADRSGTHVKELQLWTLADFDPTTVSGQWYLETGSGMGQSLNTARAMDAYILVDRATWLSFGNRGNLEILAQGDPLLSNPYGVILVNPRRCPNTRASAGQQFIDWLLSDEGQQRIAEFTLDGQPLFLPLQAE